MTRLRAGSRCCACWGLAALAMSGAVFVAGQSDTVDGWGRSGPARWGVVFALVGFALATNFKGLAHKWAESSEHSHR